jgi:hypothetical protein
MKQGTRGGLDPEIAIQPALRVAHEREWNLWRVAAQLGGAGVEDNDLAKAGGGDLCVTLGNRAQMQVADRTAREAAQLQMRRALRVWDHDRLAGCRGEAQRGYGRCDIKRPTAAGTILEGLGHCLEMMAWPAEAHKADTGQPTVDSCQCPSATLAFIVLGTE